jgi:cytochrome c553
MKYILPAICSLLLLGCSDTPPSKASSTPETSTQTPAPIEANKSSLPTTAITPTSANAPVPAEAPVTVQTASIDGGALFGQKCTACHGSKAEKSALGKSQIIAGWKEDQIKTALKGYQAGTYGKEMKAVMQGQAKGLSDAQIDALAKHISTL